MQAQTQTTSHSLPPWTFSFTDSGLSPSSEIDQIAEQCKLFRPPTIIFGKNCIEIRNQEEQFVAKWNAIQALRFVNYEMRKARLQKENKEKGIVNSISYLPPKLQIKHAEKWKQIGIPKDIQLTEVQQSSDSFFLTPFKGHLSGLNISIQPSPDPVIPLSKLTPANQMRFYKQGSLYQDELDDNGLIQYQYKFRTMADGNWFLLTRCYARVDEVCVLIMDTRVYWEPGWKKLARQFMVKQGIWSELKTKGFEMGGGWTTSQHQSHAVYEFCVEKFVENEYVLFGEQGKQGK